MPIRTGMACRRKHVVGIAIRPRCPWLPQAARWLIKPSALCSSSAGWPPSLAPHSLQDLHPSPTNTAVQTFRARAPHSLHVPTRFRISRRVLWRISFPIFAKPRDVRRPLLVRSLASFPSAGTGRGKHGFVAHRAELDDLLIRDAPASAMVQVRAGARDVLISRLVEPIARRRAMEHRIRWQKARAGGRQRSRSSSSQ